MMNDALRSVVIVVAVLFFSADGHAQTSAKALIRQGKHDSPAGKLSPPTNRHALIIGVDQQKDERIEDLSFCLIDATRMYETLSDSSIGMFPKENIQLITSERATRANVISAFEDLINRINEDDLVVVYFSGHGMVSPDLKKAYWIMHDTKLDRLRSSGLSRILIDDLVRDLKTTRLILIVDACFSNATTSKSLVRRDLVLPKHDGKGRVTLAASAADEVAFVFDEDPQKGSVYSHFLVEGLRGKADQNNDGLISVDETHAFVSAQTKNYARHVKKSRQNPVRKGEVSGDIILTVNRSNVDQTTGEYARRTQHNDNSAVTSNAKRQHEIPPQESKEVRQLRTMSQKYPDIITSADVHRFSKYQKRKRLGRQQKAVYKLYQEILSNQRPITEFKLAYERATAKQIVFARWGLTFVNGEKHVEIINVVGVAKKSGVENGDILIGINGRSFHSLSEIRGKQYRQPTLVLDANRDSKRKRFTLQQPQARNQPQRLNIARINIRVFHNRDGAVEIDQVFARRSRFKRGMLVTHYIVRGNRVKVRNAKGLAAAVDKGATEFVVKQGNTSFVVPTT